ncbi:hypothetical protein BDW69DRAFT_166382 [Aspergillus filifer]
MTNEPKSDAHWISDKDYSRRFPCRNTSDVHFHVDSKYKGYRILRLYKQSRLLWWQGFQLPRGGDDFGEARNFMASDSPKLDVGFGRWTNTSD